ncbi:MAG TPA: hypothetical protein DCM87_19150 [Planctomycetes bacterium]|nr:hypothetical protein [Planctomycetota bacterium]
MPMTTGQGPVPAAAALVDTTPEAAWSGIISRFDDACVYQTWPYGRRRGVCARASHLVLASGDTPIAAAQVRILTVPVLGTGFAHVARGPLWRRRGEPSTIEALHAAAAALRDEYARTRGLLLRVSLNEVDDGTPGPRAAMERAGFVCLSNAAPYRTFRIDLRASTDEILAGMHKKWRENLRRAWRRGLAIREGGDADLFVVFAGLYGQMRNRKRFAELVDIDEFRRLQSELPPVLRPQIFVCESAGAPVAALVGSAIGETGTILLSATSADALKLGAAYALRWRMLEYCKEKGCRWLDQGGVNPRRNPGGYQYKAGMGGEEVRHHPPFELCEKRLAGWVVHAGEAARRLKRKSADLLVRLGRKGTPAARVAGSSEAATRASSTRVARNP